MQTSAKSFMPLRASAGALSIFILTVSIALAAIFTRNIICLVTLMALSIGTLILLHQKIGAIFKVGRYAMILAILIFGLHLFWHEGREIFSLWVLSATVEGAWAGLIYGLKLLVFAYSGYIIFAAVDPFELLKPLERLAYHAGPLGRLIASAALAFFLAMRFIPELVERSRMTSMALGSRGVGFDGGLRGKMKFALFMVAPMFAGAIKKAGLIALALDIKGYGTRYYRAKLHPVRFNLASAVVFLLATCVLTVGILTA
jgi:energy-coupling factor transport system permease protein